MRALPALLLIAGMALAAPAGARETHGLSMFGDLKYPADFPHFDYVKPQAPKGGRIALTGPYWFNNQNPNTFNTLNMWVLKGDAAQGLELTFDSLMTRASDEPDAVYGLVARSVDISEDGNVYRFRLRPEARFHDGSPLTAEDVAFSINVLKEKGHPLVSQTLREVESAVAEGPETVVVTFTGNQARDLPLTVAGLPIFSKAYYETRDFEASTLEAPLASGPYKVGRLAPGRFIEYDRVEDYWARDLPVNVGRWNFDTIRYQLYRDRDVAFEGFKAGEQRIREEFTSKHWATGYDFPAMRDGRVIRFTIADETPSGAQGWYINTRREKFADPRVREALALAFDFEWTNKNLFYESYARTHSFFQNSDMMAEGPPSQAELALLEPYRDQLPAEVFGEPWTPPVSDGSGQDRRLLRQARKLLEEAGWTVQNGVLRNEKGEPFTIEILDQTGSTFDRIALPYIRNLEMLGIQATLRQVDPAQYQSRLNDFDFDMVSSRFSLGTTLTEGIRRYFSASDADQPGSRNYPGIKDPVIDALLEKIINAETREEQVTAARALDRVHRAGRYWVPHWYKPSHWIAVWNEFDRPAVHPRYPDTGAIGNALATWWHAPDGMTNPPPDAGTPAAKPGG